MSKVYILQKDLPDHKAGTKFYYDPKRGKYKTDTEVINACEPYSCFMARWVENNPEWFKEQKPKEWEIINGESGRIYKVHRLKDGEIFTIGDRVRYEDGGMCGEAWVIDNFYARDDGAMLARSKDNIIVELIGDNCSLKKAKERIEVQLSYNLHDGKCEDVVVFGATIIQEKLPTIKQAIENVLNGDGELPPEEQLTPSQISRALYLQDLENAFNAARLSHPFIGIKYDTFQDYLNSLKTASND